MTDRVLALMRSLSATKTWVLKVWGIIFLSLTEMKPLLRRVACPSTRSMSSCELLASGVAIRFSVHQISKIDFRRFKDWQLPVPVVNVERFA
jgi:hypothetical protein